MERAGSSALEGGHDLAPTTDRSYTVTIPEHKVGIPLYWSVWFERDGVQSAPPARTFKISPNQPPEITLDKANDSAASSILSNKRRWTFTGTARDPEGKPVSVTFHCNGSGYCGSGTATATVSGNAWTYTRDAIAGDAEVFFVASDGKHQTTSRKVNLRIDDQPPITTASMNGATRPPPSGWFNTSVQVRLQATDQPRLTVLAGVRDVYYNRDGEGWKKQSGSAATVTVSGDGPHTVEYYAVDRAGNSEAPRSISFKIDATPPTDISGVVETHGIPTNQWQKLSYATFEWAPSADSGSGLAGYQMTFVNLANGAVSNRTFTPTEARQWSPYLFGFMSGSYVLRGQAFDHAGNRSPMRNLYVIRSDNTPPANPDTVEHLAGILSTIPQNLTRVADFRWSPAVDAGSGIDGCFVYWGPLFDGVGTEGSFTQEHRYQSPDPLCNEDERCVGYLRLRCEDQAGNLARTWTTGFTLVYRQSLDPESKNYRLPGYVVSLGGGPSTASNHRLQSTIGQVIEAAPMSSERYRLASGYEANRPLPSLVLAQSLTSSTAAIQSTGTLTNTCLVPRIAINDGAVAINNIHVMLHICAEGAEQMMLSTDPTLSGAQWESVALTRTWTITPNGDLSEPPVVFAAFRYPDGTVQQTFQDTIIYDSFPPTGSATVDDRTPRTLALMAQDAGSGVAQVQISPNADFSGATWETYTTTVQLDPDQDSADSTRYVRFRDQAGNVSDPVSVVLDVQPPTGSVEIDTPELGPQQTFATLNLTAQDNVSGTIDMRISEDVSFGERVWQPFTTTATLPISPTDEGWGVIYVQYRDQAGNESVVYGAVYGVDTSLPEITSAWLTSGDTLTRTLTVQAEDLFTGVEWLHLSNDPMMLEGVVTLPYTETVSWTLNEHEVVWVQVEDGVGNRSLPYPATMPANNERRIYLPLVTR
ncbi:MAG: hypothetical protein HC884_17235 [Chloroflexaceae bacterium]|nr:hypothetical protein [Chloroflexaceae bacterium]